MHEELLLLSEENVRELLSVEDAIAAAEETFYRIGTGDITVGNMSLMFTDETRKNNFHSMPAVLHFKHVAGVKWISTFSAPLPGVYVLPRHEHPPERHQHRLADRPGRRDEHHRHAHCGRPWCCAGKTPYEPRPRDAHRYGMRPQARAGIRRFLTQFPSIRQVRLYNRTARRWRKCSGSMPAVLRS